MTPDQATRTHEPTLVGGSRMLLALAGLARVGLRLLYAPMKLMPTRRKVLMISRERSEPPTDFLDLSASITRTDPTVNVVVLARVMRSGFWSKVSYALHMVQHMYHAATARVLIVDTYSLVANVLNHKRELTVIQIWHAVGAFKKFGLSILGREEGRDEQIAQALRMHMGYDIVLVSSEAGREHYAEALGTPVERVRVAPLPRVDRIRDPEITQQTRERIFARYPHLREARVAMYAPTFRLNGAIPVDTDELGVALKTIGVQVVVKPHPLSPAHSGADSAPEFTTLEMLTVADMFITDYSTTVAEAALHGVPCYFLAPDLPQYVDARGFYFDYADEMPGPITADVPALVDAIASETATEAAAIDFANRWVEVPGNPLPTAGATPCTDEITRIVLEAVDA